MSLCHLLLHCNAHQVKKPVMASTSIDNFEKRTCIVDIVDIIGSKQQVVGHKKLRSSAATLDKIKCY